MLLTYLPDGSNDNRAKGREFEGDRVGVMGEWVMGCWSGTIKTERKC